MSRIFPGIFVLVAIMMFSCEKETIYNPVYINAVWTNQVDTVPHVVTSRKVGVWIRLQGTGFTGLKTVSCSGVAVSINPNYIKGDSSITFQIPSTTPVAPSGDSTITVITNHGSYTFKPFVFTK